MHNVMYNAQLVAISNEVGINVGSKSQVIDILPLVILLALAVVDKREESSH